MQVLAKASVSETWSRLRLTLSSACAFRHGALCSPPAAPPQLPLGDAVGVAGPSVVGESEHTQHCGRHYMETDHLPAALSEPRESTLLVRRSSSNPQAAGKSTLHNSSISTPEQASIMCELRSAVGPDTTESESSGLDSNPVSPSNLGLAFGPVPIDNAEGAALIVDELDGPNLVGPNLRPERHAPQRQGTLTILVHMQPES
jgi:hypothetical protein